MSEKEKKKGEDALRKAVRSFPSPTTTEPPTPAPKKKTVQEDKQ